MFAVPYSTWFFTMRTENPQLRRREIPLHPHRRFQNRLQNMAGYSTGIAPSDPPCPEPKAAVNRALFSITPTKTVTRGLALQKPRLNLSRVLRDPCSERNRTLSQICIDTLEAQGSMAGLAERKFDLTSPELRANILQFYSDLSVPIATKKVQVRWRVVLNELDQLTAVAQTVATSPAR